MFRKYVINIISLLIKQYGKPEWKLNTDPIAVLIQTILSQNTSDQNSHQAFNKLISTFSSWEELAGAPIQSISKCIKSGGLAGVKAQYIKQSLNEIIKKNGNLKLNFLKHMSLSEARKWLLQLHGVGLKTANCVLLFSLGMPALPVDTHVFRVSKRLGLVENDISIEKAHQKLEKIIPDNLTYAFHVLLIEHGRKVCKAVNPKCDSCVLNGLCLYYLSNKE